MSPPPLCTVRATRWLSGNAAVADATTPGAGLVMAGKVMIVVSGGNWTASAVTKAAAGDEAASGTILILTGSGCAPALVVRVDPDAACSSATPNASPTVPSRMLGSLSPVTSARPPPELMGSPLAVWVLGTGTVGEGPVPKFSVRA